MGFFTRQLAGFKEGVLKYTSVQGLLRFRLRVGTKILLAFCRSKQVTIEEIDSIPAGDEQQNHIIMGCLYDKG